MQILKSNRLIQAETAEINKKKVDGMEKNQEMRVLRDYNIVRGT